MPFWWLWVEDHGFDKREIGILNTTMIVVRIATTPWALQSAERQRRRRAALIAFALGAAVLMLPMPIAASFAPMLLLHAVLSVAHSTQIPLIDAMTIRAAIADPSVRYARVRVWGSVAFLVATLGVGELQRHLGIGVVWWTIVLGFVATAVAGLALRGVDHESDEGGDATAPRVSIRSLLAQPGFVRMLVASGLIQASHAAYYSYGSVHWRAAGLDENQIGLLWAEGVGAEVLLFAFGRGFAERLGMLRLFLLGAATSALRWAVLAGTTEFWTLAAVNALHAFSFGATHLAAMGWIQANIARRAAATAQGMLSAWSAGLGFALATALLTWLYPSHGAVPAFGAMIVMAIAGGLVALGLGPTSNARAPRA